MKKDIDEGSPGKKSTDANKKMFDGKRGPDSSDEEEKLDWRQMFL
jgi:hypothetical protein